MEFYSWCVYLISIATVYFLNKKFPIKKYPCPICEYTIKECNDCDKCGASFSDREFDLKQDKKKFNIQFQQRIFYIHGYTGFNYFANKEGFFAFDRAENISIGDVIFPIENPKNKCRIDFINDFYFEITTLNDQKTHIMFKYDLNYKRNYWARVY